MTRADGGVASAGDTEIMSGKPLTDEETALADYAAYRHRAGLPAVEKLRAVGLNRKQRRTVAALRRKSAKR